MYVRRYFDEASKQAALDMVADIRAEFDSILEKVDWMDTNTKRRAKQKAKDIVEHIGYPPELLDNEKLNELYAGLELNSTHYLGNALNMTVFGTNYAFSKLRERVSYPHICGVVYSHSTNPLQMLANKLDWCETWDVNWFMGLGSEFRRNEHRWLLTDHVIVLYNQ